MADTADVAYKLTHRAAGQQLYFLFLNVGIQCVDGVLELLYCIHNVIYIVCLFVFYRKPQEPHGGCGESVLIMWFDMLMIV